MAGFYRLCAAAFGCLMLGALGPATAQENLEMGKTPAQLFASDCVICHKNPHGLAKGGGVFGLSSFLREHYTASRESAAAIASYLEAMDHGPPAAAKGPSSKRAAKGEGKGKTESKTESKTDKPSDAKAGKTKPASAKSEKSDDKKSN